MIRRLQQEDGEGRFKSRFFRNDESDAFFSFRNGQHGIERNTAFVTLIPHMPHFPANREYAYFFRSHLNFLLPSFCIHYKKWLHRNQFDFRDAVIRKPAVSDPKTFTSDIVAEKKSAMTIFHESADMYRTMWEKGEIIYAGIEETATF